MEVEELSKSLWSKNVPAKVYVGMHYWHPFTEEAIEQMLKLWNRLLKLRSQRGDSPRFYLISSICVYKRLDLLLLTCLFFKMCRKKPKSKEPMVKKAKVEKGKKVKDPNMPMHSQYPYYPGQRVKVNTSTASKPARWLGGTWKDNHDEGHQLKSVMELFQVSFS
ncbi:hypothetical protein JHK85_000457 [Glycine max]|nr:hypothetical protein JHK85_000457 [Glycine max]